MASPERPRRRRSEPRSEILIHALLGAVVTVLVSFVPLSPIVGGAVAGYLERRDGLRVGAISGLIAAIPLFFVVLFGAMVVGVFVLGAGLAVLLLGSIAFGFVAIYAIVLSALGGYLGEYLATEYERPPRTTEYR